MLITEELPTDLRSRGTVYEISKGQILFQQGEPAQGIFWVEAGRLKLVSFTDQQMVTYYPVNPGESFAETALYFDTHACTAIAEQASRVLVIPKQIFLEALRQSPVLAERYLMHLTQRFSIIKRLLELRSIRSARERLLHYLLYQRQSGQSTVLLSQSLRSLAIELGLSPEALSRTFAQLEAENILSRKKGSITFSQEWLNA